MVARWGGVMGVWWGEGEGRGGVARGGRGVMGGGWEEV